MFLVTQHPDLYLKLALSLCHSLYVLCAHAVFAASTYIQRFDAVCWASGRASGEQEVQLQ